MGNYKFDSYTPDWRIKTGAVSDEAAIIELTEAERKAATQALLNNPASREWSYQEWVDAVISAVNNVRTADPIGTLRREPADGGAFTETYAFAYAPNKYLLIDTDGPAPAYKAVGGAEALKVKQTWPQLWNPVLDA